MAIIQRDKLGRLMPARDSRGKFISSGTTASPRVRRKIKTSTQTGRISCSRTPLTILFIMDRSGSMSHCSREAVSGFNEFLNSQKRQDPDAEFKLNLFDDYQEHNSWSRVSDVPPLVNGITYQPRGMTRLYDAIQQTIERCIDNLSRRYLVVIFTDGQENDSKFANRHSVLGHIRTREGYGNWTFVYMGPGQQAYLEAEKIGISRGNTKGYSPTPQGTSHVMSAAVVSSDQYVTSNARATKSFFTTDLGGLSQSQVNQKLRNISHEVKIFPVAKEIEIQHFFETEGYTYQPGRAFYQLTKKEDVQPYKELMIIQKGTKTVYGGADARRQLGLPDGLVRVTPGNHGNWDIFVQSHSTNRILVRGTKVVYRIV